MQHIRYTNTFFAFIACSFSLLAQPVPTPSDARFHGVTQRENIKKNSQLSSLNPQSIGPSIFSCRVTDVDVNPVDPTKFYVAYASAGLWYTESNGTQLKPIFDHEGAMTIGDVAVNWNQHIIWVGTGEANSSRSSYAGTGMYRSGDGGKTWEWRGLPESHHIGRIILHPTDSNTLWVSVLGHLYSPNQERGVFKTTDGGKTWKRTLFVNENTGSIDLVIDPNNVQTLYAATWERSRRAWDFDGAGEGSGIWKSTDGGENWAKLSDFPANANIGRIGLTIGKKNGKTVVYACVDNQNAKPKKESPASDAITKDQLRTISKSDFLKLGDEKLNDYLKQNDFPEKYDAAKVKKMVEKDKIAPLALVEYLEDANNSLFETDFIGAELYRSDNDGQTWKKTHEEALEQMHFTYGYYFSNVRCMPDDADQVYMIGFLIIRSEDGGKNWKNINGDNVHVDHHALWLNPNRAGHLINGNDGGINISWDNGNSWTLCNNPPVGQFYAIATDQAEPYNVYGGAQDNGVWVGPSQYEASTDWHQSGKYPYKSIMGGDGMQIQVDWRDNNTVYTGYQFGNYFRINRLSGNTKGITPKHELGERPLRFNWQTPIHLSRHQQDVLYLGANRVYRTYNKGDDWEPISGDLTNGGIKGNVPYGTLATLHESPLKMGLLYTGSDDGLIHLTRDGGETWANISDGLPAKLWVSRVQASAHERARVYTALSGYRWDDFSSYLYVSENYGKSWDRIGLDLPTEPINVVKEDPVNANILYVGTDHNLYVSLDRGKTFHTLSTEFPDVPVHDLTIQLKTNDLVIGTHGRSMYKVNVANLQTLTPEIAAQPLYVFDIAKKKASRSWGKKQAYEAAKDPELPVAYYVNNAGKVTWTIKSKDDDLSLQSGTLDATKGMNKWVYNLDIMEPSLKKYKQSLEKAQKDVKKPIEIDKSDTGKYYLRKGTYRLIMESGGVVSTKEFLLD